MVITSFVPRLPPKCEFNGHAIIARARGGGSLGTRLGYNQIRNYRYYDGVILIQGYPCEEHENPADFFLDTITHCETEALSLVEVNSLAVCSYVTELVADIL